MCGGSRDLANGFTGSTDKKFENHCCKQWSQQFTPAQWPCMWLAMLLHQMVVTCSTSGFMLALKVLVVIDTLQFLGLCCFLMIKVSAWSHFCLDRLWQRLLITLLKPLLTLSLFLATGSNEKKCLMWVHISLGSMFSDIEIAYRHPVVLLWCFECVYNLVYNTQFYHNIFKTCRCFWDGWQNRSR